ncbi:MAG: DUF2029 domain-containing protein [Anaerolineae bacterium]|nr:DUF2029 domain-containing protein [Anaerolineae bacterium]
MRRALGSLDAMLLFVLVIARARIDTLADLVLPTRLQDFTRAPIVGTLLPPRSQELLKDWLTDPLGLLLLTIVFGALAAYLLVDAVGEKLSAAARYRVKLALVWAIILALVVAPSLKLVLLRRVGGPASYTHDGGVIQTEETIKLFLAGKNPYYEDYVNTPLAEWGLDLRSAVYHYPYLPWTFVFSTPFQVLSNALIGWYDQRFVYLLLFVLMLALAPGLARGPTARLGLVMTLGLNPIMGSDVIFGQNDSFVVFWIILALWLLERHHPRASALAFGLACASKPTAWFLAPFYALLLLRGEPLRRISAWWRCGWPALAAWATLILPYAIWNLDALLDDVWRWSAGTAAVPYQIRGWGFSNLVLAWGWVQSRLDYWPFWLPQVLVCLPLLVFLLRQQRRNNTLATASWAYALLLFAFFYLSRFLNENYLGYLLAFLAMGYFAGETGDEGRQTQKYS